MSTLDKDSINLWDQTWSTVQKSILGSDEKFQVIYPFVDWTWPMPSPGYIDKTAYDVIGQIPKWSAVGNYTVGPSSNDAYLSYKFLIENCPKLTLTPEQKKQLEDVQDQINKAKAQLQTDINAKNSAWAAAQVVPSGVPIPSYEDWLVSSGWGVTIQTDQLALDKGNETKAEIVKQQNPQYNSAIEAATMPTDLDTTKAGFAKCSVNGQDEWRANYIISNGQDWVTQFMGDVRNPLSIQLDSSKESQTMKQSWAGGASDYGGFFSIFAKESWKDIRLNESGSKVLVNINIKGVTKVSVHPDQWYDSSYLSMLARQGKWNSPYTTTGGQSPVFGKGGVLPLLINSMVAGYQASFSITLSPSDFQQHQSELEASDGMRIGPLHFGGGGNHSSSNTWNKKTTNGTTFSGSSTANYPFIIGFVVTEPGIN